MGRPPLPVGTAGKTRFDKPAPGRVRARANVRDHDGLTREVTRYGDTRAKAERRLKEALRDRTGPPAGGEITADTRLRDTAKMWLAEIADDPTLADQTRETYGRTADRIVADLGGLLMREVTVAACDRVIKAARSGRGTSAAQIYKTVLSLMLAVAVRHGALGTNPVANTVKIKTDPRKRKRARAIETDISTDLLAKIAADERARELDLPDIVAWLDGTGMRIGEVLAVRAESIDLEAGVVEVCATAVRLNGKGICLQERTKTDAGWRVIALPAHLVELARRRLTAPRPRPAGKPITVITDGHATQRPAAEVGLLFPATSGGMRNMSNTNRDIKEALTRIDATAYGWITTRTFRKTVATRLDQAGLSARAIADHLGHANPSMTQDVYMGRNVVSADAATALNRTE